MAKFQPWMGTAASYAAIVTKNAGVLYFLSDTQEVYRGTTLLVKSGDAVRTSGNQTIGGTKTFSSQIVANAGISATTGNFSGQITSTVDNGTPPFMITSKTMCTNLTSEMSNSLVNTNGVSVIDANVLGKVHRVTYYQAQGSSTNMFPTTNNANAVLTINTYGLGTDNQYFHQLGFSDDGNFYHRLKTGTWYQVYSKGNANANTVDWQAKNLTLAGAIIGATTGAFTGLVTLGNNIVMGGASNATKLNIKDGGILLQDSDVVHGMTSSFYENTYADIGVYSQTSGGLRITGVSDTDAVALRFAGVVGATTTTVAAVEFSGTKKSGTTNTSLASTEILARFLNAGSSVAHITGSGSATFNNTIINGSGASTYLQLQNSGTNIAIFGSQAAIDGGPSANVGLYVYGNNGLDFYTNGVKRLQIGGTGAVTMNNTVAMDLKMNALQRSSQAVGSISFSSYNNIAYIPSIVSKSDNNAALYYVGMTADENTAGSDVIMGVRRTDDVDFTVLSGKIAFSFRRYTARLLDLYRDTKAVLYGELTVPSIKVGAAIDLYSTYAGNGDSTTPYYSTILSSGISTAKVGIQLGNEVNQTTGTWMRFFVNSDSGDNTPVYPFKIGYSLCAFTTDLTVAGSLEVAGNIEAGGTVTASAFYES